MPGAKDGFSSIFRSLHLLRTSMTGTTNVITAKNARTMSRSTTARFAANPFVVSSITTKRYTGPAMAKTPLRKVQTFVFPRLARQLSSVVCSAPKQTDRPRARTMEPDLLSWRQIQIPGQDEPTRLRKSSSLRPVTSRDQSPSGVMSGAKPSKAKQKSKQGKITGLAPARPTQVVDANETLSQPSLIPPGRLRQPFVVTSASKQPGTGKAPTDRPRHPAIGHCRPPVSNLKAKTLAHVDVAGTGTCVEKALVTNKRLPDRRLPASHPIHRPSCVPRGQIAQLFADVPEDSKGKRNKMVKAPTPHLRESRYPLEASVDMIKTNTTVHGVKVARTCVKEPDLTVERHAGTPAPYWRLAGFNPIVYPSTAWSPPPSPDLSSFPSQTWTTVVSVVLKQKGTPTTVCGDEAFTSEAKPGTTRMPEDACASLPFITFSSPLSLSQMAVPTLHSLVSAGGLDDTVKIGSPAGGASSEISFSSLLSSGRSVIGLGTSLSIGRQTDGPSTEVSSTKCAATIISLSKNGTTSMATLARVMEKCQAGPIMADTRNQLAIGVRRATEIARSFFSPQQHISQVGAENEPSKFMGNNVSRIRKLFVRPLDRDTKASKNATTQMEIEMLRVQRKVAGGEIVDPRLVRLGSFVAMAIVTKISASSSSQV